MPTSISAEVEQNNVKGAKRFFLPQTGLLAVDEATKTVTLPPLPNPQ